MDLQRLRLVIDSALAKQGAEEWARATTQVASSAVNATGAINRAQGALDKEGAAATAAAGATQKLGRAHQDLVAFADKLVLSAKNVDVQNKAAISSFEKQALAVAGVAERAKALHLVQNQLAEASQIVTQNIGQQRDYLTRLKEAQNGAAGGAGVHGLQLGRLNMELGTFIGRLTGANTATTRLAAQVGGAVVGYASMIPVLLGIAGVTWVIEKLVGQTEKAKKALDDLAKSEGGRFAQSSALGAIGAASGLPATDVPALSEQAEKLTETLHATFTALGKLPGQSNITFRALVQDVRLGAVSADQLTERLAELTREEIRNGDFTNQYYVEQLGKTAALYLYNRDALTALNAELTQSRAVRDYYMRTLGASSVAEGQYLEKLQQERVILEAYRTGGKAKGDVAEREAKLLDDGIKLWDAYIKTQNGAASASVTYQQALERKDAVAVRFHQTLKELAVTEDRISQAKQTGGGVEDRIQRVAEALSRMREQAGGQGKEASVEGQLDGQLHALDEIVRLDAKRADQVRELRNQLLLVGAQLMNNARVAEEAERNRATRQADEQAGKETLRLEARGQALEKENALLRSGAIDRKEYQSNLEAEIASFEAFQTLSGPALWARLVMIETVRKASVEHEKLVDAMEKEERASAKLESQNRQLTKTMVADLARAGTSFLEDFFKGGVNTMQRLVDAMRSIFIRWLAEMTALKIGQQLIAAGVGGAAATPSGGSGTVSIGGISVPAPSAASLPATGWNTAQTAGAYGASVLGPGVVGYGIGGMIGGTGAGSYVGAGAAGAVAGAGAGAMLGAQIGAFGGPIGAAAGAVIGGLAGLVGGIFSHAQKIHAARDAFNDAQTKFVDSLKEYPSNAAAQFAKIEQAFKELQDAAAKAGTAVGAQAVAAKNAAENKIREDFATSVTAGLEKLSGTGGQYVATLRQINDTYIEQIGTARTLGATQKTLNEIEAQRGLALQKLFDDIDQQQRELSQGLQARFMRATGRAGADYAALKGQQASELQNASASGSYTQAQLAMLSFVQLAERAQLIAQQQMEQQTKELEKANQTATAQLQTAQQNLTETKRVADSLRAYQTSLNVGPLSPLSPLEQVAQAKASLEAAFTAATGGDRNAASNLPALANTFLELSRQYNASTDKYGADFAHVQQMLDQLTTQYGTQATDAQQTVAALQTQIDQNNAQLAAIQDGTAMQAALRDAMVGELEAQRADTISAANAQIDQLNAIRDGADAGYQAMIAQQIADIEASKDALNDATDTEITAIQASFADQITAMGTNKTAQVTAINANKAATDAMATLVNLSQLDQITSLDNQRTDMNTNASALIAKLVEVFGANSVQVTKLESIRAGANADSVSAVAALKGALVNDSTSVAAQVLAEKAALSLKLVDTNLKLDAIELKLGPDSPNIAKLESIKNAINLGVALQQSAVDGLGSIYGVLNARLPAPPAAPQPSSSGGVPVGSGESSQPRTNDDDQQTRGYAGGGYLPGGLALVGESGPELVNFGGPASVIPNSRTGNVLSGLDSPAVAELQAITALLQTLVSTIESGDAENAQQLRQVKDSLDDVGQHLQLVASNVS